MRVYQCDSCNKVITNPHSVKMKEFYVGMMDTRMVAVCCTVRAVELQKIWAIKR